MHYISINYYIKWNSKKLLLYATLSHPQLEMVIRWYSFFHNVHVDVKKKRVGKTYQFFLWDYFADTVS